jgi:hypothetical protein
MHAVLLFLFNRSRYFISSTLHTHISPHYYSYSPQFKPQSISKTLTVIKPSARQQIPLTLRNSKVHCRVHKSPTRVPVPRQMNPVYTLFFLYINFNIILSRAPRFSKRYGSSRFPPRSVCAFAFSLKRETPIR